MSNRFILRQIGISALLCAAPLYASAQTCVVPGTLWEKPRSGQAVAGLPELRGCVQDFLEHSGTALEIHHGAADEVSLRAAELRYWLIALALDGARIDLRNDLQPNEPLKVEIRDCLNKYHGCD